MFIKRFDLISIEQFCEMIEWCKKNLHYSDHYEHNWYHQYPSFYFTNEKEYLFFVLKWS